MKKVLLSVVFLLLAVGLNAQDLRLKSVKNAAYPKDNTEEAVATSMNIGYCGDLKMSWKLPQTNFSIRGAIEYPAAMMKKYVGNQLTKIKVGIGNDKGIKDAKVFLAHNLSDEPFYTQDVTFATDQWNEITLTTPYQIEEKDLYIGFMLTSGTNKNLTQFSTDEEAGSEYNFIAMPGQNGNLVWGKLSDAGIPFNLGIKAVLEGNSLPQYDIAFDYLMPEKGILEKDEKAAVKGKIKSLGAQTIKSFDIVYQIGNATPVTVPEKELNLNSTDQYSFSIKDIPANQENYTNIKVTLNNFNGLGAEPATETIATNVLSPGEESVARKVLLENFTTAECMNCPLGHTTLKSVVGDNENVIWIAHHSGYNTDKYTTQEALDLLWFYNDGGATYAPGVMFDRIPASQGGKTPVMSVGKSAVKDAMNARLAAPAYATVVLEKTFDPSTYQFDLTVSGKALYGNLPGMARLNVYMMEDSIVGPQQGGGNKYVHNHVMRGSLTGTWGDLVTFDAEGNYTASYSIKLNTALKATQMKAVVFLSNYDPMDPTNCPVYNAEAIRVYPEGTGIDSAMSDDSARIYSNDSQITIDGEFTNATIFDTTGKVVENLGARNTSSKMASGVYIVKIMNNDQTVVKRIAVK